MSRIRNVALLLLVLVLAAGLASAQPGIHVTQVSSSGSVTQTTYDPTTGESSKAPRAGNYWDANDETDYYAVPPYIYAVPNPQMAVGPDDIFTIVNRSIDNWPNPNALGNSAVSNPYNNPPYSKIYLDNWMGITDLNTLCPTVPRSNLTCVIDNTTARYDQLEGRYIILWTVTDVPQHISNFYLVLSKSAQFQHGTANTSQLFTAPIAPIVGGTGTGGVGTGGVSATNWFRYTIPINVILPGSNTAGTSFCSGGGINTSLPTFGSPATAYGPITSGCSDYFPTGARIGLDNDNIILTSPVLDMSQAPFSNTGSGGSGPYQDIFGNIPSGSPNPGTPTTANEITLVPVTPLQQNLPQMPSGPYAGTRVVTVPKMIVYNAATLSLFPTTGGALNLSDDTATGTLTGTWTTGYPTGTCPPTSTPASTTNCNPNGTLTAPNLPARNAALSGTPPASGATPWCGVATTVTTGSCNPIPPIFWEPDNLRGRALASFDAQVGPAGTAVAGVVTPLDYLVGTLITDNFGANQGAFTPVQFQIIYIQPIIFNCPAGALYPAPSGVSFCGNSTGTAQVAEVAQLGVLNTNGTTSITGTLPRNNVGTIAITNDPGLVGQSGSVTGGANLRLFVGDQRPQQVIFREGLLYMARAITLFDSLDNALGSSTVSYDIIRQPGPNCATVPGGVTITACTGTSNNPYSTNGVDIANGSLVLETYWYNGQNTYSPSNNLTGFGFWGPMYDVPADVISASELTSTNTPVTGSSPISPISLEAWLEKLFVSMTTGETTNVIGTFGKNTPSLWDFRPGDDVFDTPGIYLDPYTGVVITSITNTQACPNAAGASNPYPCPMVPFGPRGSGATDPNDGSLWLYGEFAKIRDGFIPGPGHWGTSVANYQLDFPTTDPYGNDNTYFADVPPSNPYYTWIEIAKNVGIAGIGLGTPQNTPGGGVTTTNCPPGSGTNPPILTPPAGGSSPVSTGSNVTCVDFGPTVTVTRSEMARWIVLSQMDEAQVNTYLAATGGFPGCNGISSTTATPVGTTGSSLTCNNGTITYSNASFTIGTVSVPNVSPGAGSCTGGTCTGIPMLATASSFGDAPVGCSSGNTSCSYPGIFNDPYIRYIEVLYRRGYTKGCSGTGDPVREFCGNQFLTRAQMAVFIIRAKMNNVFPTSLSGVSFCITQSCGTTYGDNFGVFLPSTPYFPVDANGVSDPNYGQYYIYIQKLRELRISNGLVAGSAANNYAGGTFGSGVNITRQEVAVFVVRAFFL